MNNRVQKILEKLCKLRKSCNHEWNINGIYNKKLPYNYLKQLSTLRLKDSRKLGNSDEKKWKAQTTAKYPVPPLKMKPHSYLAENSQKATLNDYFKSWFIPLYKQPAHNQAALGWQIAKQLSGLNPLPLNKNKNYTLKKRIFPLQ